MDRKPRLARGRHLGTNIAEMGGEVAVRCPAGPAWAPAGAATGIGSWCSLSCSSCRSFVHPCFLIWVQLAIWRAGNSVKKLSHIDSAALSLLNEDSLPSTDFTRRSPGC